MELMTILIQILILNVIIQQMGQHFLNSYLLKGLYLLIMILVFLPVSSKWYFNYGEFQTIGDPTLRIRDGTCPMDIC